MKSWSTLKIQVKLMRPRKKHSCGIWIGLCILIAGCQPPENTGTPTPEVYFIPPTPGSSSLASTQVLPPAPPTQQGNCQNQLTYLKDLTIPDETEVKPGEKISKRWLIINEGSCNWDQSYSFQLISGLSLGAKKIQDLYPVRQSARAVIEISFTAPDNPGRYNTWWQAHDPDGRRFGDPLYMDITVINE